MVLEKIYKDRFSVTFNITFLIEMLELLNFSQITTSAINLNVIGDAIDKNYGFIYFIFKCILFKRPEVANSANVIKLGVMLKSPLKTYKRIKTFRNSQ